MRHHALVLALPLVACTTVINVGANPSATADAGGNDAGAGDGGALDAPSSCIDVPDGLSSRTIQHASLTRRYDVVRWSNTPSCGKLPAFFGFHALGSNASAQGVRRDLVVNRLAPTGTLGVFITGSENARGQTGWGCAGCRDYEAADDIGLVRAIMTELGIDATRTVALGADVGGSFVHRLVAELPLPAGAVVGGTVGMANSAGVLVLPIARAPARMYLQHGDNDPIFPYGGGRGERGDSVTGFADATNFWRQANGCPSESPAEAKTSSSMTQTLTCNGNEIVSTRWADTKHVPPDFDPENTNIGLEAIVDRLLAR